MTTEMHAAEMEEPSARDMDTLDMATPQVDRLCSSWSTARRLACSDLLDALEEQTIDRDEIDIEDEECMNEPRRSIVLRAFHRDPDSGERDIVGFAVIVERTIEE
jgi:predicted metal-binding protein